MTVNYCIRIFLLGVFISLAMGSPARAEDQMKKGKDAMSQGDYLKAIEAFKNATQDDKKNAEAFLLLGTAFLNADSTDQAVGALVQARELTPNDAQVYLRLGDVYWKQKIVAAAVEQYKHAVDLDSSKVEIWLKLGESSRKARQYNDAVRGYIWVLKLDSTNSIALVQLGSIYTRAKQWKNALPVYIRLAKVYPDSLPIQVQYVKVLSENGFCKDAVPVAKWVLDRAPENDEVSAIYAECLAKTGNDSIAIQQWERQNPDSMKMEDLVTLAKAYKRTGMYDKAVATYQRVLKRDSTRCDVPYDLGTSCMKVKDYVTAVQMFERKIACDTASGYRFASHLNAAMSWMQLKKFKEAKVHVQSSLDIRPDNIQAWQVLAQCFGLLEQIDSEIVAYKKVIEIATAANENGDAGKYNPQLFEAYRTIGVQYLIRATKLEGDAAKKMYVTCLEYLKKALALDARDCQLLQWTAQAYQNANNKDEARRYYCKFIAQCPTSKDAASAKKAIEDMGLPPCGQ